MKNVCLQNETLKLQSYKQVKYFAVLTTKICIIVAGTVVSANAAPFDPDFPGSSKIPVGCVGKLSPKCRHFDLPGSEDPPLVTPVPPAPAGSYQLSCIRREFDGNRLTATCQSRTGTWSKTELANAANCRGDIWNDNGQLGCNRPITRVPERVPLVAFVRTWIKPNTVRDPHASGEVDLREHVDYFTTARPEWTCIVSGDCFSLPDPAYSLVGIVGYVFNPNLPNPDPSTLVPLYSFWSEIRRDNMLAPRRLAYAESDYTPVKFEGYIFKEARMGETVQLISFRDTKFDDNVTLNTILMRKEYGFNVPSQGLRVEGHLPGPGTEAGRKCRTPGTTSIFDFEPVPFNARSASVWRLPNFHLQRNDAVQLAASGRYTSLGVYTDIGGNGRFTSLGPARDAPDFALIGAVTNGRMWVPGFGNYEAMQYFPIGNRSGCLEHTSLNLNGQLMLRVNESHLDDNSSASYSGPTVSVRQWR